MTHRIAIDDREWIAEADTRLLLPGNDGDLFDVVFINDRGAPVRVYLLDEQGQRQSFGTLEAGWRKPQQSRPGAVWLIADLHEKPIGFFQVGDRTAKAVVPTD